jgi:hypothetical protein
MRQESRAWLTSGTLEVPDNFKKGINAYTEVSLRYENVGKQPALEVTFVLKPDVTSLEEYRNPDKTRAHVQKLMEGTDCERVPLNENGMTVFPGQKSSLRIRF